MVVCGKIGTSLCNLHASVYKSDSLFARITRLVLAVFAGIIQAFILPLIFLGRMIGYIAYGSYKACTDKEEPYCERACYRPAVKAFCCLLGLTLYGLYLGGAAYNYLKLKDAVGIFLGIIAVSVLFKVYFAAQNHTPLVKIS